MRTKGLNVLDEEVAVSKDDPGHWQESNAVKGLQAVVFVFRTEKFPRIGVGREGEQDFHKNTCWNTGKESLVNALDNLTLRNYEDIIPAEHVSSLS